MANRYASILANPLARAILACDEPIIEQDDRMYLLVDVTNRQALARHSSARALQALHYIQFANTDGVIIPEGANRGWAQIDRQVIAGVLASVGYAGTLPDAYNEVTKLGRQVTEATDWLLLPFTLEELDAQAHSIDPRDGRPMRYNPDGTQPLVVASWPFTPNRFAPRSDSTFALEFSAGTAGVIPRVPLPPTSSSGKVQVPIKGSTQPQEENQMATAKKAAAKKPAAKKAAAKKAVAPKPPKAPAAPKKGKGDNTIQAPREGGTTRKVWDVCEKLLASKGTCPAFAAVNAKLGDSVAMATQRSTYAYWRKAKGFTGRVVE